MEKEIKNTTPIAPDVYQPMGLNDEEYSKIVEMLGRHPTYTEVGMFAVMWSEHCGYKYSRPILKYFKKYKEAIEGEGLENAGIIDIGDGLGICMKMESHNHPSAVEPFQGAATGVGGILRDIFTMGARPIANLNSLRFGNLDDAHNRYLFEHVVEGISHYGNCVGVPTIAGEVYFDDSYSGNPLLNAMAIGILKTDEVATAGANGVGNPVMIVGSATGKDGIHGATFASVELGPDSESKRPNVQMGDPFQEKLLIEATLEALKTGYITGIQDMGAAGITCSTTEMSAKGNTGMSVNIRKTPLREADLTPYEIMLSESQERMLAVVEKGHEDEVAAVFKKWGLQAVVIGEVTADEIVRIYDNDELVACVKGKDLADNAPTYYLDTKEPDYISKVQNYDLSKLPEPNDYNKVFLKLIGDISIASKEWVYDQYDHMVQTNTTILPGSDCAMLRVRETTKGIAVTTDCNSRYVYLNPYKGAKIAVAEAARNISCSGATPMGVTDCLNFGNPEKPEAFWQFEQAVKGLAEECEAFNSPVVSGNVSFYNETPEGTIYPTPTIGMMGLLDDVDKRMTSEFKAKGDKIALISGVSKDANDYDALDGSEYIKAEFDLAVGNTPHYDTKEELNVQACIRELIDKRLIKSAHDLSEGGLAIALAECCINGKLGATFNIDTERPVSNTLFNEAQSRILISYDDRNVGEIKNICNKYSIDFISDGQVSSDEKVSISVNNKAVIDADLNEITDLYKNTIGKIMKY
ncbi:MAG: phosphoribosylformylglycinamidine synthase subunit PurL [Abditibacteriota bacterium]|nr:phosphoribosylformylglycinamidine synthase subunit PurL [Abditibacteriota bacterium]